ncbi:NAD-dependent succinate-semialdehyde dehydrogenase [Cellulomonas sp. PhB143]|uniref:NAD-dependent succinate-semialdehyde dehydrogenase n=1 Tax=Cellulomonas sp. PhB143 TaxID=2485186 RepID=UPI000F49CD0C|nr:NAD-dependent succinate-semialdehyde dehydrogenase [Cellulomonas sp. PhB143]ROS75600.1 succinate-semialdehyde dehydrogenase/glutarate-semialdehyde dehydrogenase [Cellulomonas sp. PhB143]
MSTTTTSTTSTATAPAVAPVPDADLRAFVESLAPAQGVWVDGAGRPARSGRTFEVEDPATAARITAVPDGDAGDATAAVDAASAALAGWAATAPRERSEVLRRAFALMVADTDRLAGLMAWENGKALADARAEVAYAAEFFRWFAEEAVRTEGEYGASPAGGTRTIVTHRPVGVAALVTPWNFPAAMATRKIAPALAAGCTVVLKPAAETPLTALAVAQILTEAGVPDGVVNVVPTTDAAGVVTTWLEDSRVRKISFTGSTPVGRVLLAQAAERVVNTSMELGGNAPFVVAADADLDAAVAGAMVAKLRNGGQACTAANRLYVHADVVEEFTARLGAAVEALQVGPAFADGSQIGPLISAKALAGVTRLVDDAVAAGARVSHRAPVPAGLTGHFYAPTVLSDVPADAEILRTEIFGPVAPIATWTDTEELLRAVNDTELGLAAYVFSRDLRWALQTAERIDAGMVGVNRGVVSDPATPFGGVKQSGLGREGARDGIREFQETQYFSVDWS